MPLKGRGVELVDLASVFCQLIADGLFLAKLFQSFDFPIGFEQSLAASLNLCVGLLALLFRRLPLATKD
jgi:hypothetical protein